MPETPLFDVKTLDAIIAVGNRDQPTDAEKIVLAHQWFAMERPYFNNYFSTSGNLQSLGARLGPHLQDIVDLTDEKYLVSLVEKSSSADHRCLLDMVAIQFGFMLDMLCTKAAIIYTKLGCILRSITFSCSLSVLIAHLTYFTGNTQGRNYTSSVDIFTTGISFVGDVGLEISAALAILSSEWAVLLRIRYQKNGFTSGILKSLHRLSSKKKLEKKKWSNTMGQFDLLLYCIKLSRKKPSKIMGMIGIDEIIEKLRHTKFKDIHSCP